MHLSRKEFLIALGSAAVVGACGSVGAPADGSKASVETGVASCQDNGTSVSISGNHGHALTVSKADIAAGTAKTYDIKGTSSHAHSVEVTAEMMAKLQANENVKLASTDGGGHTHGITITCA